jgi:hypothetical protein
MTRLFQKFTKNYLDVSGNLIALAVVSSILLHSGCGTTSSGPNLPTNQSPTRDTTPPRVTAIDPPNGAVNVSENVKINVTFSEQMDVSSVNFDSISLQTPFGTEIRISSTTGFQTPTTLTMTINMLLQQGAYVILIRGESSAPGRTVKDLAGNPLANDVRATFTVGAPTPYVVERTPDSVGMNNPTTVAATARFSEALDPASVNASTVLLVDGADNPIPISIAYAPSNFRIVVVPQQPLRDGWSYEVTLKGGASGPRITNLAGTPLLRDFTWTFFIAPPPSTTFVKSIFQPPVFDTPAMASDDSMPVEVGLKFRSTSGGFVNGVRFFKFEANGGEHVGHLWTESGTLLGSVAFSSETDAGWQQALFSTPIRIDSNTTYIVSYFAPQGRYALNQGRFATTGIDNGSLRALSSPESGGNGVFLYSPTGGFPSTPSDGNNFWVDVLFYDWSVAPPRVVSATPAPAATGVSTNATLTATFSEPLDPTTLSAELVFLFDTAGTRLPANFSYDPNSFSIAILPQTPLQPGQVYTARLIPSASSQFFIRDMSGTLLQNAYEWSFFTATPAPPGVALSLWTDSAVPANTLENDANAVEVGLKFRSEKDGFITGVRFYKGGPANGGEHVGHLWTSNGNLLSSAIFTNETETGWQQALFPAPIPIKADTTYVVSYFAPHGHYAVDPDYLSTSGFDNAALHALSDDEAGGGVFLYTPTGGFPSLPSAGKNFWVDVMFIDKELFSTQIQ